MTTTRTLALATMLLAALSASACDTTYGFDDVAVGGDDTGRTPRE